MLPDNLIPSPDRTYVVPASKGQSDSCIPTFISPLALGNRIPSIFRQDKGLIHLDPKMSGDKYDYTLDFSAWLEQTGDEILEIQGVQFPDNSGSSYDLVCTFQYVYQRSQVVLMLMSGLPGTRQNVEVSVLTLQGRIKTAGCLLYILPGIPVSPLPAATIPSDAVLNGGVWMMGQTQPTYPIISNGLVLMTVDADHPPAGSIANRTDSTSNYGVLMAES